MATQNWKDAYLEIAQRIQDNLPEIEWVDLWHNQVGFLIEEHPFPTPALFLAFRSLGTEDQGELVQTLNVQIDMYYFYETFLDTFNGAFNQTDAVEYLDILTKLHALFHGYSSLSFNQLRRVGFAPVDTGSAGNLYRISFTCSMTDESAQRLFTEGKTQGVNIVPGAEVPGIKANDFMIP